MAFIIELDEGTAARRRVPFHVFNSDGTSPDTGFSTVTVLQSVNGGAQAVSTNSSSVVSANAGQYYIELTQAEVGTLGSIAIFVDAQTADFVQHVANVQIVNSNPFSTESHGNYLKPTTAGRTLDVTAGGTAGIDWGNLENPTTANDLSGTTVKDVQDTLSVNVAQLSGDATAADNLEAAFDGTGYNSLLTVFVKDSVATITGNTNVQTQIAALNDFDPASDTVVTVTNVAAATIADGTYSAVTVRVQPILYSGMTVGVNDIAAGTYSGVTVGAGDITPATYSGVTVGINNIAAGTYSGATVGINNIAGGSYSDVTIQGVTNLSGIAAGTIVAADFGAGAIDAAALATDAVAEIADAILIRNIEGGDNSGRTVGEALAALRNRVQLSDVSYIVYRNDDTTIWWHASISTVDNTVRVTDADPDV